MEQLLKFKQPVLRSKTSADLIVTYIKNEPVRNKKPSFRGGLYLSKKFISNMETIEKIAFSIDKEQKEIILVLNPADGIPAYKASAGKDGARLISNLDLARSIHEALDLNEEKVGFRIEPLKKLQGTQLYVLIKQ
jgi:hypothetical protein